MKNIARILTMLMPIEADRHNLSLTPDFRGNLTQTKDPEINRLTQRFDELFKEGRIKIQYKSVYTWEKDPVLLVHVDTRPNQQPQSGAVILVYNQMENSLENRRKLFGRIFDAVGAIDKQRGTLLEIQRKREELCAKIN